MEKVTVKELRRLVRIGAAEEITECKQITESVKQISYSSGVYGLNGALLRGEKSNKLYAIIGRTSALFYYC
jgi:hypothetical protein